MTKTEFDLGPADKFAVGWHAVISEIPALVTRSDAGFSALSLKCTHLGCTVEQSPEGFTCPCHGSRYDAQGQVQRGPATKPLPRWRAEVRADGRLFVYTD